MSLLYEAILLPFDLVCLINSCIKFNLELLCHSFSSKKILWDFSLIKRVANRKEGGEFALRGRTYVNLEIRPVIKQLRLLSVCLGSCTVLRIVRTSISTLFRQVLSPPDSHISFLYLGVECVTSVSTQVILSPDESKRQVWRAEWEDAPCFVPSRPNSAILMLIAAWKTEDAR